MAGKHYVLYVFTAYGGFDANQDEMKFLPLTYNGEVTKLTWPWVIDIKKSEIYIFLYPVTLRKPCKLQRDRSMDVARKRAWIFPEVGSLNPRRAGGAFLRPHHAQVFRRYLKNGGAQRPRF